MNDCSHHLTRLRNQLLAGSFGGLVLLTGCGGSASDGTDGTAPSAAETSIETWTNYCIATFTEDYPVLDGFGEVAFTARVGEEYVMASFDVGADPELVYLANTGPDVFSVTAAADALPFVTNCAAGSTTQHLAVFSDVTVYAEQELSTPICELAAGSAHPRDLAAGAGYGATGSGVTSAVTYEIILNAFSADCGGASQGFISVPQTSAHGTTTWLVPIAVIVGPG